jgi:hypothetical protein
VARAAAVRRRAVRCAVAAAAALLSSCEPWRCDFWTHGACIEFTYPAAPDAQARVGRLLDLELPYWDLHKVSGWRIQLRTSPEYPCYFSARNDGCTDYIERTISVLVPPDSLDCFEASELLHELGHYALGDPMHTNARWAGVDAQFPAMVWDRPDAPASCVKRYAGIREGMWPVRVDQF